MHRTDRLYDLIQILRDGRLHRASEMAARLGVSVRTIWRDMATLVASGLPVEGERGVGYLMRSPITLPPMILTGAELDALRQGLRLVAAGDDAVLARAAVVLEARIASVTPARADSPDDGGAVLAGTDAERAAPHLPILRKAIRTRQRLTLTYIDHDGHETHRDVRPLALELCGRVSSLAAWCESRAGFRSFRVDRIVALHQTGEVFAKLPGCTLEDYRARQAAEAGTLPRA